MATGDYELELSAWQSLLKRGFDIVCAIIGLLALGWLVALAWIMASIDLRCNGFFVQDRVGRDGRIFRLVKIRTMRNDKALRTTVTQAGDPRITRLGAWLRRFKVDELPQLWNVLIGDMSLVGPRPDVPGFADILTGKEKSILSLRPGITGPATLKYRNEEALLAAQDDPELFNREVIFPDKVEINLDYIRHWSFTGDLQYLWSTVVCA